MGAAAYGRKVHEDAGSVSYTFATDPQAPEGVVVIPVADLDGWYVEGAAGRPPAAERVLIKAVRMRRLSGAWPELVAFQS